MGKCSQGIKIFSLAPHLPLKYLTVVVASLLPLPYRIPGTKSSCLAFVLFVSRTDLQSNTVQRKTGPRAFLKRPVPH